MRVKTAILSACATFLLLGVAACGQSGDSAGSPEDAEPSTLRVFAAASLTDTFTGLAATFEEQNPEITIELNFAGSSDLVAQLQEGAPADVLATADERNMDAAADLVAGEPSAFVTNTLTIAVELGNPLGIEGLADLAGDGVDTVICAEQVPCGGATVQVLDDAGVDLTPVSEESSVTSVLSKVSSGQADAGLVYRTDAAVEGSGVEAVDFPESDGVVNLYPIGALADSASPEQAEAFVDFILSEEARAVFDAAGFGAP